MNPKPPTKANEASRNARARIIDLSHIRPGALLILPQKCLKRERAEDRAWRAKLRAGLA